MRTLAAVIGEPALQNTALSRPLSRRLAVQGRLLAVAPAFGKRQEAAHASRRGHKLAPGTKKLTIVAIPIAMRAEIGASWRTRTLAAVIGEPALQNTALTRPLSRRLVQSRLLAVAPAFGKRQEAAHA